MTEQYLKTGHDHFLPKLHSSVLHKSLTHPRQKKSLADLGLNKPRHTQIANIKVKL
jgi:hypothetical protein